MSIARILIIILREKEKEKKRIKDELKNVIYFLHYTGKL